MQPPPANSLMPASETLQSSLYVWLEASRCVPFWFLHTQGARQLLSLPRKMVVYGSVHLTDSQRSDVHDVYCACNLQLLCCQADHGMGLESFIQVAQVKMPSAKPFNRS